MARDVRCPFCGAVIDPRGCHRHMEAIHGLEGATKKHFEPVRSRTVELDERTRRALEEEL